MLFFSGRKRKREEAQKPKNPGVERGAWGEEAASRYLRRRGWRIIEKNARPYERDGRKEIDLVAFAEEENTVVFVEVKAHKTHPEKAPRAWGVNKAKKKNLLPAFRAWLRSRRWAGNYRFDIIEVYGETGSEPEIDHLVNVPIFPSSDRFFRYG